MRLALHAHHHPAPLALHLSATTRAWLRAAASVTLPYLIAALALFAYHEQWFQ